MTFFQVNDFNCKSFMYNNQTRTCILSDERSKPLGRGSLVKTDGFTYYEKKCFACKVFPFSFVPGYRYAAYFFPWIGFNGACPNSHRKCNWNVRNGHFHAVSCVVCEWIARTARSRWLETTTNWPNFDEHTVSWTIYAISERSSGEWLIETRDTRCSLLN